VALQRMYPKAHFCSWSLPSGWGTHTAAGTWTESSSSDCAGACDDLYGALDETDYGFARSSATAGTRNNGRAEFTFDDPPQNVTIAGLTLVLLVRTSNGGPASIDTQPTLSFFVDPGTGVRSYQVGTSTVTSARNRNTEAPAESFQEIRYTWTSKPAGGAWTRSELLSGTFKAGFESSAVSAKGSGIDATTGGSSASLDWAQVYVELETTPTGAYIEPNRVVMSHSLRLLSAAQRTVEMEVGPTFGDIEPGSSVWSSHDVLPWSPGVRSWEQVQLLCYAVRDRFDPPGRVLSLWDLREVQAAFWSPFRITAIDDVQSGLALYHRGGGWGTTRAQVAYGQRPGDGLYQSAASNKPLLTKDGLLIQGGSDVNYLLYSTFSAGSFTGWTSTVTGSATLTADTADYMVDVAGMQQSCKATTTAAGENCYVSQTVAGFAANTKLFVRCWYKNNSGSDPLFVKITRSVDGWSWNDGAGAWQAAAAYFYPAISGTLARTVTKQIDVGAAPTSITVFAGFLNGLSTTANTAHIYAIELQLGTTFAWCRRDLLPTTTVAVTRTVDICGLYNQAVTRIMDASRGYFKVCVTPLWSHEDLPDGGARTLMAQGPMTVYYTRTNSTTGAWVLSNGSGSAQFATAAVGDWTLPVAGATYTIAGRWTSTAEDEHDVTGQALKIWVDGVAGSTVATGLAEGAIGTDDTITLGNDSTVGPYSVPIDAVITNLVMDLRCPPDDEMARV